MSAYEIKYLTNSVFDCLIIATSFNNPCKDLIESGAEKILKDGAIVFDLAVINDLGAYRFAFAKIKDGHLLKETLKYTATVNAEIMQISQDFFREHTYILDDLSMLPSEKAHLLNDPIF